eukprot:scaffold24071_cov57-Phaeocystis_antarctica.AAC.2
MNVFTPSTDVHTVLGESTPNMFNVMMTLDVSKASGWWNALASCRAEMRAYDARGKVRAGRWEGGV